MRDVATCPELSSGFTRSSEAKLSSGSVELRADSAPSVLPASQSTTAAPQVSASQCATGVSAHQLDVGGQKSNVTDTSAVVTSQLQPQSGTVTQPAASMSTEAATELPPPTVARADTVASADTTSTPCNMAVDCSVSSDLKCTRDEEVDDTHLPTHSSDFVYHEENACDCMPPTLGDSAPDSVVPCTSLPSETVTDNVEMSLTSDPGRDGMFAGVGAAVETSHIDDPVGTAVPELCLEPDCLANQRAITGEMDYDSNMSVTIDNEACQMSAAVDDFDDDTTLMACNPECGIHDETHSTFDDTRLVSRLPSDTNFLWYCI